MGLAWGMCHSKSILSPSFHNASYTCVNILFLNCTNCISQAFLEAGKPVHACMKADFREEAMGNVPDENMKKEMLSALNNIFLNGIEVYKGYSDDPRNTDNAWIETSAFNYHDEDGTILKYFTLRVSKHFLQ